MITARIAVPTCTPGGLTSALSDHFGHCDLFTLVDITDRKITGVHLLDNIDHDAGGCARPVSLLKENKVDSVIVSGMGARPLQKFSEAGIKVYYAPCNTSVNVSTIIDGMLKNIFLPMDERRVCQGHGNCHH
jgi:predicted Fe-Mo cluster-binding NifX family protein